LKTVTEENQHPMTPPLLREVISPVNNGNNRNRDKYNAGRFFNKTMISGPTASPSELRILDQIVTHRKLRNKTGHG
jgi:hypothetical protein